MQCFDICRLMLLVLLYRPAYLLKVKEVGAERLTNFNKGFRNSKILIKITRMSPRISVMMMMMMMMMMMIIIIIIIIIVNRELRAFVECS